jgi:hypothetical protein
MIAIRIVASLFLILGGGILSFSILNDTFHVSNIIIVDGVINIWGCYASFLAGIYSFFYWINQITSLPFSMGDFNRTVLIISFLISPLLTIGIYQKLQSNTSGYMECKGAREFSSRYSSRTYVLPPMTCEQL